MLEKMLRRAVDIVNMGSEVGNSKNGPSVNKFGSNRSGQFNRGGGNSGMKYFGCGETGHRLAECKKTARKKALFVVTNDYDNTKLDIKGEPIYDEEAVDEVYLEGDVGTALVV